MRGDGSGDEEQAWRARVRQRHVVEIAQLRGHSESIP